MSWTDVARYMYAHGYDLRHFATMGIVPASVEMIVRAWWLCRSYESGDNPELARAKLTSMLLLGHTMAVSGNLLKMGVIFGMNPLALNWAQMLALFPSERTTSGQLLRLGSVAYPRKSPRGDAFVGEDVPSRRALSSDRIAEGVGN